MRKFLYIIFFLLSFACNTNAQNDSVLVFETFLTQVVNFHPIAQQAKTLSAEAKAELRLTKGMLDPSLVSNYYRKRFDGKNYYTLWDNALKIPTWYGVDFKAGYEVNNGIYVNEENQTPTNGLSYLGVSVPIGQGLIIDERRNAIKQAKILQNIAEAEKVKVINKLLLQASKDFWNWSLAYQKRDFIQQGYVLAQQRFLAVKERVVNGDLPAIDSIEAKIAVQERWSALELSKVDLNNTRLILSNHLWLENNVPAELDTTIAPQQLPEKEIIISPDSLLNLLNFARENHPEIQKLNYKLNQLKIEQRYAADKLKPKFNVNYNLLQSDFYINSQSINSTYMQNNYKLGVYFNYPLLLRQERGKLQMVKIKNNQTNFELQFTNREIENNIKSVYNDLFLLNNLVELQAQIISNNQALRNGEQTKFNNGESSFFLINTRETNLINAMVKLAELKTKYQQNKVELLWSAGKL